MAEASGSRQVVTVGGTSGQEGQPVHRGKATSWPGKVFKLNPAGLNWPRAVMVLDVLLVPLIIFWAVGHEEYLLSALFGVLFAATWLPATAIVSTAATCETPSDLQELGGAEGI